jgi:hypothetical protein
MIVPASGQNLSRQVGKSFSRRGSVRAGAASRASVRGKAISCRPRTSMLNNPLFDVRNVTIFLRKLYRIGDSV